MPDSILRAFGWVLAHSIWQAAVAALALLILLPRLKTARQRYGAAYGSLVAVLLAAVGTFVWIFEVAGVVSAGSMMPTETAGSPAIYVSNQLPESSLSASFSQWLETNHTLIVALWLIGFSFFFLRLGAGLWQIKRLRTRGLRMLESVWQEKMRDLGDRIGVSQAVRIFESVWVSTPLTIGWLKPVILLPIGFVNQLSMAEVEAVLAHELAHIARRDWVFNLLQAFVESLFYYHPAVWWISQIIRRERENACDDAALTATGNPIAFARALVQVQEMATPLPVLALAMSGKRRRRPLLERVRRILNQAPPQQHQVMEKITATLILLALLALVGLRANTVPSIEAAFAQIADIPSAIFNGEDQISNDSVPNPKHSQKITREDDNGRVEAEYKEGKLQRLNIDGKEIPEAEFAQHQALIEGLEGITPPPPPPPPAFFGSSPEGQVWEFPEPAEAPEAPEPPEPFEFRGPGFPAFAPMPPLPTMPPMGALSAMGGFSLITDKDSEGNTILKLECQGKQTSEGAAAWNGISTEQRKRREEEYARVREDYTRDMEEHRRDFERDQKNAKKDWKNSQKEFEKQQKNWEKEQQKWQAEQEVWQQGQQKWAAEQQAMQAKNEATQERIKKELLRDGLITNPNDFSLQLNAKELKVNKKKQSEEMRRKYAELIESATGNKLSGDNSFLYNYSE